MNKLYVQIVLSVFLSLLTVVSLALRPGGNPQTKEDKKKFRQTMKLIDKGQFRHAEANLLELWKKDSLNLEYNYELALLYFYDLKMSEKAHRFFLRVRNIVGDNMDEFPELYYYLGQTYHFNGEFENAINQYRQCNEKELQIKDEIAGKIEREIAACSYAMTLSDRPDVRIRNLSNRINTWFAEYVPVPVTGDSLLLFTSQRPPVMSTHYGFEGKEYFEKIYISRRSGKKYSFAEISSNFPEFNGLIYKKRKHTSVVGVNYEGNVMLLYRKNKLWTSEFSAGKWQKPVKIQKSVNFSFYQPHVSMTKDGNTVYFSSWNKKTGFGKLDIYRCEKNQNGNWGQAVNLGMEINTSDDEDSPEISPDGKTLYFSSKGHKGIGGFDIFKSELVNGQWTKPVNMGLPVNSPGDDIFFRFSKDERIAYFSSYRKDGLGNMDIYEAEFLPLFFRCNDSEHQAYAAGVIGIDVPDTLTTGVSVLVKPLNPRSDKYHFNDCVWKADTSLFVHLPEIQYTFMKPGVYNITLEANVVHNETKETETCCISRQVTVITAEQILAQQTRNEKTDTVVTPADTAALAQTGTHADITTPKDTLTQTSVTGNVETTATTMPSGIPVLQNVYFGFDRADVDPVAADILNQNIAALKKYSDLKVIITAHTDSQGDAAYNKQLSERRAKSVYQYLINNGIDKSRIAEIQGMGMKQLPEPTSDAPAGTISYHKLSRRCEIRLVK